MPVVHVAKAYKADGQNVTAVAAARRCVELAPRFADSHYLLGQLYRDTAQAELAQREFDLFREMKNGAAPSR